MNKITNQLKKLVIHSLILLAIGLSVSLTFSGTNLLKDWSLFINTAIYCLVIGLSLWWGIGFVSTILNRFLPSTISLEKNLVLHMVATLVYSLFAIFFLNYLMYNWLFGYNLMNNPRQFTIIGAVQLLVVIIITGVHYVLDFLRSLRLAIKEQEALKREALLHNYEALKNQLSPHFMFNSLSVLSALVEHDAEKSQKFIKQLSEVYRYVLEQKGEELVSIKKEMDFVNAFVYLHQIRHDSSLNVEINLNNTKGYVIPMSVQLLVENALKHNEVSAKNPLTITIEKVQDHTLVVSNNLQPRKGIQGNGLGLGLLTKRCNFLMGRDIEVIQQNGSFTVHLPVASENIIAEGENGA